MTTKTKPTPPAGPDTTPAPGDTAHNDTVDGGTQDVHFSDVHDADPVDQGTSSDKPSPAPERAETLDEKRARLRAELATVEEQGARQGGFKETPTHVGTLLCGHTVPVSNTNATQYFCAEHDAEVPFVSYFAIPPNLIEKFA